MISWYHIGKYTLIPKGDYSMTKSYVTMLGYQNRVNEADLSWKSVMMPRQRVIVWLAYHDKLLTKEAEYTG